jgi:hypothetical protein
MRIDFEPDLTSDTHFANTGVRYSSSYIEVKQGGNTIVGSNAHKAYYAMNKHFNYKNASIEKEIEFLQNFCNSAKDIHVPHMA